MKKSVTRIGVSVWNFIPLSVKTLNVSNFRKKQNHYSLLEKRSVYELSRFFVCFLFCFAVLAIFSESEFKTNTNRPSPS